MVSKKGFSVVKLLQILLPALQVMALIGESASKGCIFILEYVVLSFIAESKSISFEIGDCLEGIIQLNKAKNWFISIPGYSDWRYFLTEILLRKAFFFPSFRAWKRFGRYKYLSLKVPKPVAFFPARQPHLSPTFGQSTGAYGKPSPESSWQLDKLEAQFHWL